jgi:hypothetical protein
MSGNLSYRQGRPTAMFCRERVQGDLPHRVPDLDLGPLGVWDGRGRRSAAGHLHARLARILIARRLVPLLPHRAPTHHQRAERVSRQGVRHQRGRPWFASLIDVVIVKIIERDLA